MREVQMGAFFIDYVVVRSKFLSLFDLSSLKKFQSRLFRRPLSVSQTNIPVYVYFIMKNYYNKYLIV
jgi:hypothetical protein